MPWFVIAIFSYLLLAGVNLIDKYLLTSKIPDPKVYTFYIGVLGGLIILLAPFVGFYIPGITEVIISLLAGAAFIYSLYWFYKGLHLFEASRIVPAVGGLTPLFTFVLVFIFSMGQEFLSYSEVIAFVLLIAGSFIINFKENRPVTIRSLKISALAAFFLSLSFVLSKFVFLGQPFWNGLILMRVGGLLVVVLFYIFSREIRDEIFERRISLKKKTISLFISNQIAGAGANILQNLAIALAPLASISIINALQGVQYVLLLIFTVLLSIKFPHILKEEVSRRVLGQKILAIVLIGAGILILSFF